MVPPQKTGFEQGFIRFHFIGGKKRQFIDLIQSDYMEITVNCGQ